MKLEEYLAQIKPFDQKAADAAWTHWDSLCKPLRGMGKLEDMVVQLAGIYGTEKVENPNPVVVIMGADNGVVAEGVTQSGQEVTAVVAGNMARRTSSVCRMAQVAGAQVYPVDIGMAYAVDHPGIAQKCVRRGGTGNFAKELAMTRAEAEQAVLTGVEIARELHGQGVNLLAMGEMGIGNTTTSAAVLTVLLGSTPREMTGRGAGLSDEGLKRKVKAIETALALHQPDPEDAIDILSKVGGFDLAGLCGLALGAALCRIPVLLDGLISCAAALLAVKLCPAAGDYLLASHLSAEPAGWPVLNALGVKPLVQAGMRLGEGTGAVAVMPMLDMAMVVYHGDTFDDLQIEAYTPQSEDF